MKKLIKFYDFKTKLEWWLCENFDEIEGMGVSWVIGCGQGENSIPDDLFDDANWAVDSVEEKDFSPENYQYALDENIESYTKYFKKYFEK